MPFSAQGFHDRVQVFLAHHPALVEQLRRPLRRRQLGFQLPDTPPGRFELSTLTRRRARDQALVDPVLALPAVQRRLVHLQLPSQPGHRPASPDLVQHHLPELRRISKRHPNTSQIGTPPLSQTRSKKRWTHQVDQKRGPVNSAQSDVAICNPIL